MRICTEVPVFETEFGLDNTEAGSLGSVCLAGFVVGCTLIGSLTVHIPPGRTLWAVTPPLPRESASTWGE